MPHPTRPTGPIQGLLPLQSDPQLGPVLDLVHLLEEAAALLAPGGQVLAANRAWAQLEDEADGKLSMGTLAELVEGVLDGEPLRPRPLRLPVGSLRRSDGRELLEFEASRLLQTTAEGQSLIFLRQRPAKATTNRCAQLSRRLEEVRKKERTAVRRQRALENETESLRDTVHELEATVHRDPLTGLANRLAFEEHLQAAVGAGRRLSQPLTLVLIDLDDFKAINDSWGHPKGDEVLRGVAQALAPFARRAGDLVARLGGEEFALLLPDCDEKSAQERGEAVRQAILAADLPHPVGERVTASVGLATRVPASRRMGPWYYRQADLALYAAKRGGKDQVRAAG